MKGVMAAAVGEGQEGDPGNATSILYYTATITDVDMTHHRIGLMIEMASAEITYTDGSIAKDGDYEEGDYDIYFKAGIEPTTAGLVTTSVIYLDGSLDIYNEDPIEDDRVYIEQGYAPTGIDVLTCKWIFTIEKSSTGDMEVKRNGITVFQSNETNTWLLDLEEYSRSRISRDYRPDYTIHLDSMLVHLEHLVNDSQVTV